jgi:hypothetical protein
MQRNILQWVAYQLDRFLKQFTVLITSPYQNEQH